MMANSFHSIISEMETSFLKIFTNAAAKMADLTESKVFIVFESSDGSRQIGGNQELVTSFQSGYLLPQPTDEVIGETTYQFQPKMNSESHRTSNSDHRIVNGFGGNKAGTKRHCGRGCCDGRKRYRPAKEVEKVSSNKYLLKMKPRWTMGEREQENVGDADIVYAGYFDQEANYDSKENFVDQGQDQAAENDPQENFNPNPDYDPKANYVNQDVDQDRDHDYDPTDNVVDEDQDSNIDTKTYSDQDSDYNPKAEWQDVKTEKSSNNSHKKKERIRCELCPPNEKTYTREIYRRHKAAVHEKKFECPICSKGFSSLYYLNRHNKSCLTVKNYKETS